MPRSPTLPATIHADVLCRVTGYTDRTLRDIAKRGYFPPPERATYQCEVTLAGLFRYANEKQKDAETTKLAIEDEKLRRLKTDNDAAEGLLVRKTSVAEALETSLTPILAELRLKIENELPMSFSGMDVATNRVVGKRLFDDLCAKISAVFLAWKI